MEDKILKMFFETERWKYGIDKGGYVPPYSLDEDESIALDWLDDTMKESDAMSWEYNIDELIEEE